MNLYLLKQDIEDASEGSDFHYNSLLNHPDVILLDDIFDFQFDGIFFQNVNTISLETSCIFEPEHYTPSYLINNVDDRDKHLLLNHQLTLVDLDPSALNYVNEKVFIKPYSDLKLFSPTCLSRGDKFTSLGINGRAKLAVFPFKDLTGSTEFRSVIVDGNIVSIVNTQYNGVQVEPDMYLFVNKMAKYYQDVGSFVLDFIVLKDMYLVVEINPLETSGFFGNYDIVLNALKELKG